MVKRLVENIFRKRILVMCLILSACLGEKKLNLDYVDPTIGSVGVVLEPTRPTVHLPNSMVRVFPDRKDQLDDQISNFFLTITSHRLNKVFGILPISGKSDKLWSESVIYDNEEVAPYYYYSQLDDSYNEIEFTPGAKSGFFRIKFEENIPHYLRMMNYSNSGKIEVENKRIITGTESFEGMKAYFYAEVDTDISKVTYKDINNRSHIMIHLGDQSKQVSFKYGISYISIDQAKENLLNEIPEWDFEAVKGKARNIWKEKLSQINVKGGTEEQRRIFYTSLYRSYERMVDINEYGKYYSAYDKKVHVSNEAFFVDNWIWDTYIALEPLTMILDPEMATERIRSYIKMYEQGGAMPSFALIFGDWPAMIGNHAAAWMADAWFKGLRDFDLKTAYEGLKKNSQDATLLPWRNGAKTILDDFYNENGYMPGLYEGEEETVHGITAWERRQAVSVTIENSYDDWCIAQLAKELNLEEDRKFFLERAHFYKNVFRADKGIMWPKDRDGDWIEPYDPRFADRIYFTENNAFTYNWYVKHDLKGMFRLMDETKGAEAILDQLFREDLGLPKWKFWYTQPDATGLVGQFVMGNEPSFHIPYIYNYLGAPWKTQKRIRTLLDAFFTDSYFGIPGDEDGGGMSAFVVFSMMGFFQVTQGIPVYTIGSPVFDEVRISLPTGKEFQIIAKNNSSQNKYIQKAFFNGSELNRTWFTHQELVSGGLLELEMGDKPNKQWGSQKEDLPPSEIDFNLCE